MDGLDDEFLRIGWLVIVILIDFLDCVVRDTGRRLALEQQISRFLLLLLLHLRVLGAVHVLHVVGKGYALEEGREAVVLCLH